MSKDVRELLSRGVEKVIPRELAESKLNSGEKLRIYFGVDPTGAKLHLGHSVPLRKLRAFADAGHHVIFVVGSFTAMIGDPSGRDAMRAPLTREKIEDNFKTYQEQAAKILDLSKVEVRYNHEWLDPLRFEEIVKLASNFTVQQMLQRDMFDNRIRSGNPVSLHEFLYPVMVGYDSVVLDVDGELGGSDQEFNMLAGRTLQTAHKKRDKFVLTTPLIEGTDGRKMSKTYNNAVYFEDAPGEMYGKLMSIDDGLVRKYLECLTDVSLNEIDEIIAGHPKAAKERLAKEIVTMYHSKEAAEDAHKNFLKPTSAVEIEKEEGETFAEALIRNGIVKSKTEFSRLEKDGAIEEIENGVYRIGKHRFVKLVS